MTEKEVVSTMQDLKQTAKGLIHEVDCFETQPLHHTQLFIDAYLKQIVFLGDLLALKIRALKKTQ